MKRILCLINEQVRKRACEAIWDAPEGFEVVIKEPTRTTSQNSMLWSRLNDVAKQVEWHGRYLGADEWKCVFTAALKRQDVVPGLDGGFVVIGQSTSQMGKRALSDLIELIHAFGAEREIEWTLDGEPTMYATEGVTHD